MQQGTDCYPRTTRDILRFTAFFPNLLHDSERYADMLEIQSSLHAPDDACSRLEPGYSPRVAAALTHAYQEIRLHSNQMGAYLKAARHLSVCKHEPMSLRQRMRVFYALCLIHSALGGVAIAVECTDEALESALSLHDHGALIELTYLRGMANARQLRYSAAADDYNSCLEVIDDLRDRNSDPTSFEVSLHVDLAFFDFALGNYDRTSRWLEIVGHSAVNLPADRITIGTVSWVRSLLLRWQGNSSQALHHAMVADEIYTTDGTQASQGRIKTVVADIAMDLAENFSVASAQYARPALLDLAQKYVLGAVTLCREAGDDAGANLAILATTRHEQLSMLDTNRIRAIESVMHIARKRGDIALLSQAYTALGREYTSRGRIQNSLYAYTRALDLVSRSDVRSIGIWARRALSKAREMCSDTL